MLPANGVVGNWPAVGDDASLDDASADDASLLPASADPPSKALPEQPDVAKKRMTNQTRIVPSLAVASKNH